MPPRRELSQDQIQEIRSLRGQLPAAEAKKRFGIGSTRLYKIWQGEPTEPPAVVQDEESLAAVQGGESLVHPTVADFYNRLGRLESRADHATDMLVQVLAALQRDDESDDESDLFEEMQQEEIAEQVQETRHEQIETQMDLQKVGQLAETARGWAYISIAAVLVWKIVARTWNRCAPPTVGRDTQKPPAAAPPPPPDAKPGSPFYME